MSFDVICKSCGAVSGPSVGICPFCKTLFSIDAHSDGDPTLSRVSQLYADGKLEETLSLVSSLTKDKPELENELPFLLLHVKTLLESEGPISKLKALLSKAYLVEPGHAEVAEYLEIVDAREKIEFGSKDLGEQTLKNVLRRSPKNVHALFLLATELFWNRKETVMASHLLQRCVDLRPVFLRAWACLGAIYKASGSPELADRAFRKCLVLETHPKMQSYFKSLLSQAA